MKTKVIMLLCFICLSCKQSKTTGHKPASEQTINFTFVNASWNAKILSIISSFVNENNCDKCIFELYINKVLPNYLLINIKARPPLEDYLKRQNPLLTTVIDDRLFYIYCGLEDDLAGDKKMISYNTDTSILFYKIWTIVVNGDSLRIKKDESIPFLPSIDENPYYNRLSVPDSAIKK